MAHTTTLQVLFGSIQPALIEITSYTNGAGEQFTAAEFNALGVAGAIIGQVAPGSNSLGVVLFPVLTAGGVVKLYEFSAGAFTEIATTAALNATFVAFVFVTAWLK